MSPWWGVLGLSIAATYVGWRNSKRDEHLKRLISQMEDGIRATDVGRQYLIARYPGSFSLPAERK